MDLRRVAVPDQDVPPDPELAAAIRDEIRATGPLTFARFMEIALYDPERGYYRGPVARPGRGGDFLTAPEASPIFGRSIARLAAAIHAAIGGPPVFEVREYGAGTGALAAPLTEALLAAPDAPSTIRYRVAEIEPARVDAVERAIGNPGRVEVVADDGAPIDGLVIANEVLDALPTHRVIARDGMLREVFVDLDGAGALTDIEADPSTPELALRLAAEAIELVEGQRAEICLRLDDWMATAATGLRAGVLLLIDYGHPAAELYDPRRRMAGTLATYLAHRVGDDPYRAVGRQDITAHVDVTSVQRAAAEAGLAHLGTTTQGEFLGALGAGDLLVAEQTRPGGTLQAYLETRSALVRMIDPGAMGRFRVLAFGRGLEPGRALPGFG